MSVAFLFPGQGAQYPGMLHTLPNHAAIAATLKEASEVLGQDALDLDSEDALGSTVSVQLALLIAGTAQARALQASGAAPDMVAGLSVGTFTAATIAESLSLRDALLIVRQRGILMKQAAPPDSGLGAIVGLNERQVQTLIAPVNTSQTPVFLANINAPRQMIIAGSRQGLEIVLQLARKMGARKAAYLNVSVPSHCPLMDPVTDHLTQALANIHLQTPRILYIGNRYARVLWTAEDVRIELSTNAACPVRWYDLTTNMYERGARLFIELPPGHVLTELAAVAFPQARALAASITRESDITLLTQRVHDNTR
ncbi:malonate decarboxylase subunit epsilon [Ktedonospora formicarum]|uniref:Malonyl CoA-acyl carrier protein transacylase n=1 Tax=Ktedonospora formicarum TaxID=2778364 RepID=A0A8J3IEP4_9CHLR|nr:malonate decarboxylase subunit epsilon [Ktedonospora formicarum]GHO50988.1 malonyl CoA-acyl carrier protein transacylase [Ktedonospora formicarum]